jgi:hypothetical protein
MQKASWSIRAFLCTCIWLHIHTLNAQHRLHARTQLIQALRTRIPGPQTNCSFRWLEGPRSRLYFPAIDPFLTWSALYWWMQGQLESAVGICIRWQTVLRAADYYQFIKPPHDLQSSVAFSLRNQMPKCSEGCTQSQGSQVCLRFGFSWFWTLLVPAVPDDVLLCFKHN